MGQNHRESRVGAGYKGGEIVEVEGGHIVRSTGRKDRHSKVCTAKGPRDRRVRLSAHTAIQFYDVQDRLGYDRPSKAVDWLIKKAKAAIDELDELPAWQPIIQSEPEDQDQEQQEQEQEQEQFQYQQQLSVGMREEGLAEQHVASSSSSSFDFQNNPHLNPSSNFLPPSLESDAIADTIKSFFPASSSTIHFQNYPPDLLSRTNSQDLRLSLQSFHDPMLFQHHQDATALNHHHQHQHHHNHHQFSNTTTPSTVESLMLSTFAGESAAATGGGGGIWSWNNADTGGIHVYNPLPLQISQNQFFTQRGPLQSSYSPLVRARTPPVTVAGGFSGFRIPARIQGEEEQDSVVKQQSSASSASRH